MTGRKRPRAQVKRTRPRSVHVALGERAYDILIGRGIVAQAPEALAALGARAAHDRE